MAKKTFIDLAVNPTMPKCILEGTKRGINEYRLRDNAPIIHDLFDQLDNFLKRKDDDELPHQLLNPIISEIWVRLISFIAEICSIPEKSIDCKEKCPRATYLGLVFEIRSIFQRLQNLTKKYDDGFIRMARLYGSHYDHDSRDLFSKLVRCGFYDDSDNVLNDARENLVFLQEKIKETKYKLKPIYYNINSDIQSYASYAWSLLEDVIPSDREIQDDVEIAFNEYSKKFRNDAMRKLKREVQQYKPYRGAQLTPEVWGEVLRAEDDVLDLAIKGGGALVQSTDKRFEYYGEDMRQLMENNYCLLQKIKDVALDEQLFDLKYAAETHINLFDKLTAENLDLFLDLILRRNLIQCEMFPALKSEYEAWLNDSDGDSGKSSESSSESETEVPTCVSEVFNHTSDFIKNIVKTIIDSHYGNKPVNMALIEITLYDHSVIKERNQHQKFIEALIAWEFFDEKMKARTISGMSSKFSKLENTGYKEWKKNKKDQNKCIEIARNFDKTTPYRYKNNDLTD